MSFYTDDIFFISRVYRNASENAYMAYIAKKRNAYNKI